MCTNSCCTSWFCADTLCDSVDSPLAPAEIQRVPPPPPTPLLGFSVEENDHKVSGIIIGATEQLDAENQWSHLPKCRFIHDDDAVSDSEESDTSLSPLGFGFSLSVDDKDASSDGLVSGSTPNIVELFDTAMDNDWLTQVNIRLLACAEVKEYCELIEVSKDEGEASYDVIEIETCVYPSPILGGENKFRDIKEDLKVVNQKIIDEVCSSRTHHLENNIDSTRRHITLQRQYGHVDLIRLAIETTSNEDGSSDVESVGVDREIVSGTHPAFALGSSNGINGLGCV